jgi:fructosamine-3-kinase
MSMGDIDISWQSLRRIVHDWAGTATELTGFVPLHGGQINTTLELHLGGGKKVVLKISPHRVDKTYEREAYQLNLLRDCGLPVPQILAWNLGSLDEPFSYLLMEFVDGVDLGEARKRCTPEEFDELQVELADLVATMHDRTNAKYMRVMAGGGDTFEKWPDFYRAIYDAIWNEAKESKHLPKACKKQIGKLHDRLERFLVHTDQPRLVHWDLWNTNVLCRRGGSDGKWHVAAVLDPNCKYAHSEAEIAYLELFHTTTPAFAKAYHQRHKLTPDYHQFRKPIYQLYPLINDLNLFGEQYAKPLVAAVERTNHLV